MNFNHRQTTQSVNECLLGNLLNLTKRFPLSHYRNHAGSGNSCPTAKGLKYDILKILFVICFSLTNLNIDLHYVTANRVAYCCHPVGVFQFPHVLGISNVFPDFP